jgi:hypothetical protein
LALPPNEITDDVFVREVNEELQRDELLSLWQRYGKPAIAVIVALLLAWAGYLYWQHRKAQAVGLQGEDYTQVIDTLTSGSDEGALAKLAAIKKSDATGYHAPASLLEGGIGLQKNEPKKAVTAFGAVASDTSAAQPWRDLALIRQTATEFDTLKPETIVARLKPLVVAGTPWFGSAGEMTAAAYLRMNKTDAAAKLFADLAKDESVPESIRNRSSEMANALGVESNRPVPKGEKEGTQ